MSQLFPCKMTHWQAGRPGWPYMVVRKHGGPRFLQIADALQQAVAAEEGIAAAPAGAFATEDGSVNAIRISPGCIKDRRRLKEGLQRLSRFPARRPASFSAPVVSTAISCTQCMAGGGRARYARRRWYGAEVLAGRSGTSD